MSQLQHGDLVLLVKNLYPQSFSDDGICNGVAIASLQAIMADDLNTFQNRIHLLGNILETKSPDELAHDILKIESTRVHLIKEYKKELLSKLAPENITMNDADFYRLLRENQNHPEVLNYQSKRNVVDSELTQEQRDLNDIHAFLDTTLFYFSPRRFPDFFEENAVPSSQKLTDSTLILKLPDTLVEEIPDNGTKASDRLYINREPLIKNIGYNIGVYNLEELTEYFKQLHPSDPGFDPPIVLLINNGEHIISVSYNQQLKHWQLIDANSLPIIVSKTDEEIAEKVLTALSNNENAVISTSIYSHKKHAENAKEWLSKIEFPKVKKDNRTDSSGYSLFHLAVIEGKLDLVQELFDEKPDIDQTDRQGTTPLARAIKERHLDIVKFLIKNGADLNVLNNDKTLLMLALSQGDIEIMVELIKGGADIDQANSKGSNPLSSAINRRNLDAVKVLLEHKASIEKAGRNDMSALDIAITRKDLDIVKELLKHGANPNLENGMKLTPFLYACEIGDIEVIKLLIEQQPNIIADAEKNTYHPLSTAASHGHAKVVKLLMQHHASVTKPNHLGFTPINYAIESGNLEIFKLLTEQKDQNNQPLIDLNKAEGNGFTPILLAVINNKPEIVNALLKLDDPKINVNASTSKGITAVYIASQNGHTNILQSLLPHLSNETLNFPIQASANTLLKKAKAIGFENEINLLGITEGTNIDGFTPLHAAVFFGHLEVVKLLINAGCDIHQTTQQGISPMDFARAINRIDILKELNRAEAAQQFKNLTIPTGIYRNLKETSANLPFFSAQKTPEPTAENIPPPPMSKKGP